MIRKTDLKGSSIPVQLAKSLHLDRNKELSIIRVCRNNDISFLGLFGSYSRAEQKEKSDIDFLAKFSRRVSWIMSGLRGNYLRYLE